MAEALYDPERGYYVRHGAGRDYRSAPQTSPAFGHLIGRALALMWRALGQPGRFEVLELGAGDGRLAEQATGWLRAREPGCSAALRYVAIDRADARPIAGAARVVADAAARPGEQDLTAHAEFGRLERAGWAAGLETVAYLTQRDFLLGLGLRDWLGRLDPAALTPADLFNARAAAAELVAPGQLGKFKVLLQARGVEAPPAELTGLPGQRGTK